MYFAKFTASPKMLIKLIVVAKNIPFNRGGYTFKSIRNPNSSIYDNFYIHFFLFNPNQND